MAGNPWFGNRLFNQCWSCIPPADRRCHRMKMRMKFSWRQTRRTMSRLARQDCYRGRNWPSVVSTCWSGKAPRKSGLILTALPMTRLGSSCARVWGKIAWRKQTSWRMPCWTGGTLMIWCAAMGLKRIFISRRGYPMSRPTARLKT